MRFYTMYTRIDNQERLALHKKNFKKIESKLGKGMHKAILNKREENIEEVKA